MKKIFKTAFRRTKNEQPPTRITSNIKREYRKPFRKSLGIIEGKREELRVLTPQEITELNNK